jgi:hypothetical protein
VCCSQELLLGACGCQISTARGKQQVQVQEQWRRQAEVMHLTHESDTQRVALLYIAGALGTTITTTTTGG